jgi:hypothetical protein
MKRMTAALLTLLLVLSFLTGCADYGYRHHVSGRIIDKNGQPVAGALVKRVTDMKSEKPYGIESLYLQRTDMDGNFLFFHQGLGPKPEPRDVWHLVVSHPDYLTEKKSFTPPSSPPGSAPGCP